VAREGWRWITTAAFQRLGSALIFALFRFPDFPSAEFAEFSEIFIVGPIFLQVALRGRGSSYRSNIFSGNVSEA